MTDSDKPNKPEDSTLIWSADEPELTPEALKERLEKVPAQYRKLVQWVIEIAEKNRKEKEQK